jgi:hypothetical protein
LTWILLRISSGEVLMQPKDLPAEARSAFNVWRWMGVSEQAAMDLLRQDGLVEESGLAGSLASIFSLNEEAAKVAARGRESVSEARGWDSSRSSGDVFEAAREALARMSDAECDQVLVEEQKRRKASKATSGSSGGSLKKQTTVSERGWRG